MERQRHPEVAGFLSTTSPTPRLAQIEGILVNSKETLPPQPGSKPFRARAPTQTLVSLGRKRPQESAPAHAHVRAHTHTHTQLPACCLSLGVDQPNSVMYVLLLFSIVSISLFF